VESTPASEIIRAIRADIEMAAESMLSAAEEGLRQMGGAREGQVGALDKVERILCAVLEACAFQDLAGQRLSQLQACVGDVAAPLPADPLLNGPAARGQGVSQSEADALLSGRDP
jgi:hypothetical protein